VGGAVSSPGSPHTGYAGLVRRALAGHAALGLIAAGLIYLVSLTGTLAVIHDRWQRWEQPDVPEFATLSPSAAQAATVAAFGTGPAHPGLIAIQLPTDDLPRAILTGPDGSWFLDAAGRPAARVNVPWTEFLVALHENLLLPASWGYALVGALGVALGSLGVTGVLGHPRIVRDAFRLRWRQGPPIARVDWHNRLGVWTLPFTLAVAMTGAVLGLSTIAFPVLADAYGGGDVTKAYAPLFGSAPAADARAAPVADVAAALAALHGRAPTVRPTLVTITAPGTRGQEVTILAVHPRRLIYGETYRFDGAGRARGRVGLSDGAPGQQAVASAYGLHFGSFGGLPVELAYMLFGTALCIVTATGPSIWLHKRRRRGLGGARLQACWNAVIWGTPFLLIMAAWLRFASNGSAALGLLFWSGYVMLAGVAVARPAWFGSFQCRSAVMAALASTGIGHMLIAQPTSIDSRMVDLSGSIGAIATLLLAKAAGKSEVIHQR
jgi:uncharacterized iron-regulated membrane protein